MGGNMRVTAVFLLLTVLSTRSGADTIDICSSDSQPIDLSRSLDSSLTIHKKSNSTRDQCDITFMSPSDPVYITIRIDSVHLSANCTLSRLYVQTPDSNLPPRVMLCGDNATAGTLNQLMVSGMRNRSFSLRSLTLPDEKFTLSLNVGVVHPLNETESPIDVSLKPYGYIASHQSFNFKRTKVVGDKGNLRLRLIGLTRTSTIILQIIFFETETRHPLRVEGILPIPYKIRTGDDRHVVIPPIYDHDVTFRFSYDHYKPFRFSAHRGFFIQYKVLSCNDIPDAYLYRTSWYPNGTAEFSLFCNDNHVMETGRTRSNITCRPDGSWSRNITCQRRVSPTDGEGNSRKSTRNREQPSAGTAISISLGILSLMLLTLMVVISVTLRSKLKRARTPLVEDGRRHRRRGTRQRSAYQIPRRPLTHLAGHEYCSIHTYDDLSESPSASDLHFSSPDSTGRQTDSWSSSQYVTDVY